MLNFLAPWGLTVLHKAPTGQVQVESIHNKSNHCTMYNYIIIMKMNSSF